MFWTLEPHALPRKNQRSSPFQPILFKLSLGKPTQHLTTSQQKTLTFKSKCSYHKRLILRLIEYAYSELTTVKAPELMNVHLTLSGSSDRPTWRQTVSGFSHIVKSLHLQKTSRPQHTWRVFLITTGQILHGQDLHRSSSNLGAPVLNKLLPEDIELSGLDRLPYRPEEPEIVMRVMSAKNW